MNILLAVYLRVMAVYLAISIFNTINFVKAANLANGKKMPLNPRRLRVAVRFGFGWQRSLFHWLLDWYLGLTNIDRIARMMRGR